MAPNNQNAFTTLLDPVGQQKMNPFQSLVRRYQALKRRRETETAETSARNRMLVNALYREVLQRDAEEGGLAEYARMLDASDRDGAIIRLIHGLLHSPEFQWKASRNPVVRRQHIAEPGTKQINGKAVQHIVSLGTHCLSSYLLKKYGLKNYSLPFDWLFSSPDAVIHCIDDNFKEYLTRSHYTSRTAHRETKEPGADHQFYLKNFRVGDMFAHRDPTTEDDYRYFENAVRRFNRLLESDDTKLFLMVSRADWNLVERFEDVARKVASMTSNSELICVQLREPTLEPGCHAMTKIKRTDGATLYQFTPSSAENGKDFAEAIDDAAIMRLVWNYSIALEPTIQIPARQAQCTAAVKAS